jgi:PIN domain nuclease of toxin-antitoxin system
VRLLIDTHALLRTLLEPSRLSAEAAEAIADERNQVLVSAASAFEIALKQTIGKLRLPALAREWLPDRVGRLGQTAWLPVSEQHALRAGSLPLLHKDPFDRLLIAQAMEEELTLVTSDRQLAQYGVSILPA